MANQPADIAARANRAVIIAALIGAAATIITAFGGYQVGATATPTSTATVTSTVTATLTSTATVTVDPPKGDDSTPPPATNAPETSGTVRFQGSVRLEETISDLRTDLDLEPPTKAAEESKGDLYVPCCMTSDAGDVHAGTGGSLVAKWPGDGTPDFEQCKQTALAEGGNQVPAVKRGSILCVKTGDNRIARLKVVEVVKFSGIRADTVVWENE